MNNRGPKRKQTHTHARTHLQVMHPEPTTDPNANFLPAVDRAILMEGLEGTTRSHSHVHLRPYSCYSTPPGHPISPPPVQEPQVTQCEMYFLSKLHHQCAWKETELLTKRKLNDTTDQDSGAELFLTVSVLRTRLKLCTPILPITCTHTQTHTNTHQSEKAGSARTQKRITICFLLDCTAWTDPEGKGGANAPFCRRASRLLSCWHITLTLNGPSDQLRTGGVTDESDRGHVVIVQAAEQKEIQKKREKKEGTELTAM